MNHRQVQHQQQIWPRQQPTSHTLTPQVHLSTPTVDFSTHFQLFLKKPTQSAIYSTGT
jgi:hypothetical protein